MFSLLEQNITYELLRDNEHTSIHAVWLIFLHYLFGWGRYYAHLFKNIILVLLLYSYIRRLTSKAGYL